MDNYEKTKQVHEHIINYSEQIHKKNKKRTVIGIWCIVLIPAIFLILMLSMPVSKSIYLILWIVSLFCIAGYLIAVEYIDYSMQEQLKEIGLKSAAEMDSLVETNVILEKLKNVSLPEETQVKQKPDKTSLSKSMSDNFYFEYHKNLLEDDSCYCNEYYDE